VVPRAFTEPVALLLLAATLAFAVVRPRGLPEAVVAIPAALLTLVLGILPAQVALEQLRSLAPTIGFLAAVLVLADLCDREGLFEAAGRRMATGARGRPLALLGLVFVAGSAITAVLSLDATVVLLTPVVFATAVRLQLRPKPHVYACTHLANSASLLLPVSNLTNLLSVRVLAVTAPTFAGLMWPAAVTAVLVTVASLAVIFRGSLRGRYLRAPVVVIRDRPLLVIGMAVCVGLGPLFAMGVDVTYASAVAALLLVVGCPVRVPEFLSEPFGAVDAAGWGRCVVRRRAGGPRPWAGCGARGGGRCCGGAVQRAAAAGRGVHAGRQSG
jgi:arsenical pump membrane protein